VAVEILPDGRTGNLRMGDIENFKADTLKYALKDKVNPDASIRTDDYCSYYTLQQQGMNISIERSQKGKAFEELHRQIMQFKNWLVGIHHKWSKQHLFAYVDEYVFRFNRRNTRKSIFNDVIDRMMQQIPHPYPIIKNFALILPNPILNNVFHPCALSLAPLEVLDKFNISQYPEFRFPFFTKQKHDLAK
jgi:transposase-like protein